MHVVTLITEHWADFSSSLSCPAAGEGSEKGVRREATVQRNKSTSRAGCGTGLEGGRGDVWPRDPESQ